MKILTKIIGIVEIIGGVIGVWTVLGVVLWGGLSLALTGLLFVFSCFSIWAGIKLWKQSRTGALSSMIVQIIWVLKGNVIFFLLSVQPPSLAIGVNLIALAFLIILLIARKRLASLNNKRALAHVNGSNLE